CSGATKGPALLPDDFPPTPSRRLALAMAIFLLICSGTVLVLVKLVLEHTGPLTVAALRYALGSLLLVPLLLRFGQPVPRSPSIWRRLIGIGVGHYVLGQVLIFWGLKSVPATTTTLLMSFIPVATLIGSILWLDEVPHRLQVVGGAVALGGSLLFFSPGLEPGQPLGIAIICSGIVGNASLGVLGRGLAREGALDTMTQTHHPLGAGGAGLAAPGGGGGRRAGDAAGGLGRRCGAGGGEHFLGLHPLQLGAAGDERLRAQHDPQPLAGDHRRLVVAAVG
ncbi:MAG: DMT family transporter, partial [Chloroflexi bacterium]|nr:DMT family transporter [Chloroflexota bacterium]